METSFIAPVLGDARLMPEDRTLHVLADLTIYLYVAIRATGTRTRRIDLTEALEVADQLVAGESMTEPPASMRRRVRRGPGRRR